MNDLEKLLLESKKRHFISLPRNPDTRHTKSSKPPTWMPDAFPRYSKPEPVNESILLIEEISCEIFGCGNTLTMTEKLFGQKCIEHQTIKNNEFHNGKL